MRLIDADELIKKLQEREDAPPEWEGATFKDAFSISIMEIIAQPSIDAVEVIRCKDCKWYDKEYRECHSPNWNEGNIQPEGFYCGWAYMKGENE